MKGKEECHQDPKFPAAIPDARSWCRQERSTAKSINLCIQRKSGQPAAAAMGDNGRKLPEPTWLPIRCACDAWRRADTPGRPWWIISNRIAATRRFSGIGTTGRRSASPVTTEKPGARTRILCTIIEENGHGRHLTMEKQTGMRAALDFAEALTILFAALKLSGTID